MTNNNYSFMQLAILTDANILEVTSPKDGKKRLALTFKAKADNGEVISFTEYAMAEPQNELQARDRQKLLNRAPYLTAGRKITTKTGKGIQRATINNTIYANVTGWIQNMGTENLDLKKAEARKKLFNI